jgi:TolB protein
MSVVFYRTSILLLFLSAFHISLVAQQLGDFHEQVDIGTVLHKGSVKYNNSTGDYVISGSGANIWNNSDQFHFVWRKLKGDFILQARVNFIGTGKDPHRKLGWMVRNSLDTNSSSVNATIHGDGLTSLQFRRSINDNVEEKKFDITHPDILQLERKGSLFIMSVAHAGEPFVTQEVSEIPLRNEVFAGLFICAHNKDVVEKATFDNVRIIIPASAGFTPYKDYIGSHIETFDLATGKRRIIFSSPSSLQAPNWTKDGKAFIYNSNGLIYRLDLKTNKSSIVNTGAVKANNNDHVISFDGKMLALSSSSPGNKYNSVVYTIPIEGGTPKQVTAVGPSYMHGWSPDRKHLIYTGQRDNEFDIYRIDADGNNETRLTSAAGLDDGSEYSPDGEYIYFNSMRTGTMQIWRMKANGSEQVQLTSDDYNNWFPHISPDGKNILFLSFMKDVKPEDHPFYKQVYLRMMPVSGGIPKVLVYVYGGQGTINTPSWSPDSKQFAFVSNSDPLIDK